jgi:hypothetical protein
VNKTAEDKKAWARKELVPKLNTVPVSQQRDWDARMEREK